MTHFFLFLYTICEQKIGKKTTKAIGTNKRKVKRNLEKLKRQEHLRISQKNEHKKQTNAIAEYRSNLPKDNTDANVERIQLLSRVGQGVGKNVRQILEHHNSSWKEPEQVKVDEPIFKPEDFASFEKEYFT